MGRCYLPWGREKSKAKAFIRASPKGRCCHRTVVRLVLEHNKKGREAEGWVTPGSSNTSRHQSLFCAEVLMFLGAQFLFGLGHVATDRTGRILFCFRQSVHGVLSTTQTKTLGAVVVYRGSHHSLYVVILRSLLLDRAGCCPIASWKYSNSSFPATAVRPSDAPKQRHGSMVLKMPYDSFARLRNCRMGDTWRVEQWCLYVASRVELAVHVSTTGT